MILTLVPSVTCSAKRAMSLLCIRMQPFDTAEPMSSGSSVPCMARAGLLPSKSSKASECLFNPNKSCP